MGSIIQIGLYYFSDSDLDSFQTQANQDGKEKYTDLLKDLQKAIDQLLSDKKVQVQKKYGVWGMKSFLGKKFMGTIRSTIAINKHGKILRVWPNVRVKNHAQEVLDFIKSQK